MNNKSICRIFLLLVMSLVIGAASAIAQDGKLLGTRDITDRVDHDTIYVTAFRGELKQIKFRVTGNPVRLYRCVITYGNRGQDRCNIRALIRGGGETRWIDLHGNSRIIHKVDLWYDSKTAGFRRSRIWLYGRD
jgi:Protein of unknown function (DUF2541)